MIALVLIIKNDGWENQRKSDIHQCNKDIKLFTLKRYRE